MDGEVILVNLHIFLSTFSKAGFLGIRKNILMEPEHFSPQRKDTPQIPAIQVVSDIRLPFCWDLLVSHNFLKNQDKKKTIRYPDPQLYQENYTALFAGMEEGS